MRSAIFIDENKFTEADFESEKNFEITIRDNSKLLFGNKTIYLDTKNKIESKSLGNSIPDGILFDLTDKDNPEFYLVEVELANHDFYDHIFPQITKFFAFYKNSASTSKLIETLFRLIKSNPSLENEFKKYLDKKELYKWLKDTIENSQNILIIIDENKPEFKEIFETYTDTWGKMVKIQIIKGFKANNKLVLTMNPDFEAISFAEPIGVSERAQEIYTEDYHLEGVSQVVKSIYAKIKEYANKLDSDIKVNPQHYYISLRKNKNFVYIYVKRQKIWITIMLPYKLVSSTIKYHKIVEESQGVQKFYGNPCISIMVENEDNLNEVLKLIEEAYKKQNK